MGRYDQSMLHKTLKEIINTFWKKSLDSYKRKRWSYILYKQVECYPTLPVVIRPHKDFRSCLCFHWEGNYQLETIALKFMSVHTW